MTPAEHQDRVIETWLLGEAMSLELPVLIEGLAYRLVEGGIALHRLSISFGLLNPSLLAGGMIWRPGRELEFSRYNYINRNSGMYERSPFKAAAERGNWLELDLDRTPDDTYGIVPELKADGLKHYIVITMQATGGRQMTATFATRSPAGFTEAHKRLIRALVPALRATVELKSLNFILRDVLSAYVGRTPAREIVNGTVHRGQTSEVRAAIFVADLRRFTSISTQLPAAATAEVINRYYDVVVPPIEAHGGEVLKFIGDAVLAIFPTASSSDDEAVVAALDAGRAALEADVAPFEVNGVSVPIHFGVAIHVGDAAYGNVGSGDRLDFTVIGRDVNIAARIASLCSRLGRNFLVSEPVAEIGRRHGRTMTEAGAHDVRGIERPVSVFVPDVDSLHPEYDDGISHGLTLIPST